jgi:Phage P22-like portal protein
VRGPEKNVKGKVHVRSMIRKGRDAQKLLNWTETSKGELIAMIPHAPWQGTPEQIQPFDKYYQSSNVQNYAWLPYKPHIITDDSGNSHLIPPPTRVPLGQIPVQLFQFTNDVKSYIEDATGVGRPDAVSSDDPSRTGRAANIKRTPSDVSTFPYIDNLHRGIAHGGRIMNAMLPEVYDTPRDVRILVGEEDPSISFMPVNMNTADAYKKVNAMPSRYQGIQPQDVEKSYMEHPAEKYNDLGKGEYDVIVKVGPPYSTAREEAAEQLMTVAVQGAKMNPLDKYFIIKNMSLSDGGEYATALRNQIPPHILPPKEGEKRPQIPQPPQLQLMMAKAETEKLKQQNLMLKTKHEMMKMAKDKETDKETRKLILKTLAEVYSPEGATQGGPPA